MLNDKQMKLAKNVVTAQFDAYFDGYQTAPTEEEFYSVAESVRNAIPSTLKISDEEYEKILLELRQTIGVRIFGTATKNIFVKTKIEGNQKHSDRCRQLRKRTPHFSIHFDRERFQQRNPQKQFSQSA